MVLQKRCFGELQAQFLGTKFVKMNNFGFFVTFPIYRTKIMMKILFKKKIKVMFFFNTLWGWCILIGSSFGSKLRICIIVYQNSGEKLPLFSLYSDLPIFFKTLITIAFFVRSPSPYFGHFIV